MIRKFTVGVGIIVFALAFIATLQLKKLPVDGKISGREIEDPKLESAHILDAVRWYYRQRAYPASRIPDNWRENALRTMQKNHPAKAASVPLDWSSVGPDNIGGRTRAIAIDPNDHNIIYAGAVSGGVWKSTNGGVSWTPKTDNEQSLIVSTIAIDPANSSIIYAGTGEGYFNYDALRGTGILKSTDAGETWTLTHNISTTSGYKYYYINKIVVRPGNSSIVYAAMLGGAYRSTDAGASWTRMNVGAGTYLFCMDIVADPTNQATVYAAFGFDFLAPAHDGIYKSTNSGSSWVKQTSGFPASGYGRISLAISASNSQVLYACLSDSATSGTYGIEKTTNGGASWAAVSTPNDNTAAVNGSHLGNQGWYDNVITVDPTDELTVYTGGINLFKTTDGGTNWTRISDGYGSPYVHVDQHAITVDPTDNQTVYFGNDGGIFKSTDGGGTFSSLNGGYVTTQFYSVKIHPQVDIRIGGTQDNGTLKTNTSATASQIFGGDGGYTAIDPAHPATYYTEYVYLSIQKSTNSGTNWSRSISGIPASGANSSDGTSDRCAFIAPFVMDPANSSVLVAGTYKVYRTTNGGGGWSAISTDLTGGGTGSVGEQGAVISALAIAQSNDSFIYVGTSGDPSNPGGVPAKVWLTTNLGSTWTNKTKAPLPNRFVSTVAVDPANEQHVYVGFQGYNTSTPTTTGHVFVSTNGGTAWTDISGDLPDVPVNKILLQPDNVQWMLAATDLGVFQTFNGGTNWVNATGIPNVPVFDLDIRQLDHIVLAGTHGRGVYQSSGPLDVKSNLNSKNIPGSYSLGQNYPNPFNPSTSIPFTVSVRSFVVISVYDVTGREVATLVNQELSPGSYTAVFDARNYSSGVYYYRFTSSGGRIASEMKKMVLLK